MSISIKKTAPKFSQLLWFSTSALSGKLLEMFYHFNVSTGKARELRIERVCCDRLTQPPVQGVLPQACKQHSGKPKALGRTYL
jgi:hypothetical protein